MTSLEICNFFVFLKGEFPEWTLFLSPDRVETDGCLKQEGRTSETVSFNFIHNIMKSVLPTLRGSAMKHKPLRQ